MGFTLVGVFWCASQVVTTWSTNWWLFNTFFTEVTHDDFTFASTFGGHAFDVIVEDHLSGLHDSTSIIAGSCRIAFFQTWKIEAFSGVGSTAFSSSSSNRVRFTWWANWWMFDAKTIVALALVLWAATLVFVEADRLDFNEFLTFSGASWNDKLSTFFFQIWNESSTTWSLWALVSSATSIFGNEFDGCFTEFANWFFLVDTSISDVVASDFSGIRAATWLANVVFIVEEVAFIVSLTFMLASVAAIAAVRNTTAIVNGLSQLTTFSGADWGDRNWAGITDTSILHATVQSLSFVSD